MAKSWTFFDFRLIRFPIFNVADVCINIGIVCLIIAAFRVANDDPPQGNGGKRHGNGGKKLNL